MRKWKMVKLGEVLDYEQPTKYIVESTNYNDCYGTPVLTAGQTFILGYTDDRNNVFQDNLPVIIFDDFTTAIKYVNFPFKVKSSAMKILKAKKEIAHIKYLFYCMSIVKIDTQLHKRYWISKYTNIEIPLPPLEEQKRIADILDKASNLIDLRKQQLEKMDSLIKSKFIDMFGDPVTNPKVWKVEKLEKHISVIGGYAFKSNGFSTHGVPVLRIGNINSGFFKSTNLVFWNEDQTLARYMLKPGDMIISLTGTVGKDDYGNICILGNDYSKYYLNQRNAKLELKNTIDKRYLANILKMQKIKSKLTDISRGVRQANIANADILNLSIPIPPVELQNQFAAFVEQVEKQKVVMQQSLEKMEMNYKALMQQYFG